MHAYITKVAKEDFKSVSMKRDIVDRLDAWIEQQKQTTGKIYSRRDILDRCALKFLANHDKEIRVVEQALDDSAAELE